MVETFYQLCEISSSHGGKEVQNYFLGCTAV
jgi:hypothetical protein